MALPPIAARSAAISKTLAREEYVHKHRPRLVFALDATASRQEMWDLSSKLQAEMFTEAGAAGLDLQLVYYRGDECKASRWVSTSGDLAGLMRELTCKGGMTQLGRVLAHTLRETEKLSVKALVFIGDCYEENINDMAETASMLGAKGVRAFMFHDQSQGPIPNAKKAGQRWTRWVNPNFAKFLATVPSLKTSYGSSAGSHIPRLVPFE
jgi:hypothetical protein